MMYFPFQRKEMRGFTDWHPEAPEGLSSSEMKTFPTQPTRESSSETLLGVIWYYRRIPFVSPLLWKKLEMCLKWSSSNAAWHTVLFKLPLGRWELSMQQVVGNMLKSFPLDSQILRNLKVLDPDYPLENPPETRRIMLCFVSEVKTGI